MVVVKIADQDIFDKVDTQYIKDQFSHLQNVGIVYVCIPEGGEEDDWTDDDGLRHIVIYLPYDEVRHATDIRPMMLAKAKERLGLVA